MLPSKGYAAQSATTPLAPFAFERRDPGPADVQIDILYCGVCHSDLHTARGEWPGTRYPCLPGHEIVGRVAHVGGRVSMFKPGDLVGVGCMVDSCRRCASCAEGLEQYCENGFTGTYNGPEQGTGNNTYGGYSNRIVVDEKFVLKVRHPEAQLAAVAPLLCAGITTWSPLRQWEVGAGQKRRHRRSRRPGPHGRQAGARARRTRRDVHDLAEQGGGRGQAGRARSRGVDRPQGDGGAEEPLRLHPEYRGRAARPRSPSSALLKRDGTLVLVGAPSSPHPSPGVFNLIFKRRSLAGSLIGGIAETQEMLDFCAEHHIVSDIEMIPIASDQRSLRADAEERRQVPLRDRHGDAVARRAFKPPAAARERGRDTVDRGPWRRRCAG